MLEKCRQEHGSSQDNEESYLQFRPRNAKGIILVDKIDKKTIILLSGAISANKESKSVYACSLFIQKI